jgi:hypothetical protein
MNKEKVMSRLRIIAVVTGMILASSFASAAFADGVPNLSVVPALSTVSTGDSFAVDVNIADVTDLYDYQFDLSFNPAVLQATNVLEGSFFVGGVSFFQGFLDNTAGTITFVADSLSGPGPGLSGGGTLVEFDFTALAAGLSDLTISNVILQDSTQVGSSDTLPYTTTNGSVNVQGTTAVPEPSNLLLLTAGLTLLVGLSLKRVIH